MYKTAMKRVFLFVCVLALTLMSGPTLAHPMPNSVLLLDIHASTITGELQMPLSELSLAVNEDLLSDPDAALNNRSAQLKAYLIEHIRPLTPEGQPWAVSVDDFALKATEQTATGPYQEVVASLTLTPPAGASPEAFTLYYDAVIHQVVTHSALVSVRQDWANGLSGEQPPVEVGAIRINPVDGTIAPLEINRAGGTLWTGFVSMFRLGMSHIRSGTDHLLFLLTLLLSAPVIAVSGRWQGFAGTRQSVNVILKVITAFTLGHSLTLILGAAVPFSLPTQPIEALIALSILVSAAHALRPLFPQREMLVAGGFGLIHGMAFSFTLAELNLSTPQMILSLLGFNLGIEAMQLLVIVLVMPWLILLAQTSVYVPVRVFGAAIAGLAALGWLGARLGYANGLSAIADGLNPYGPWVVVALAGLALISLVMKQRFRRVAYSKRR